MFKHHRFVQSLWVIVQTSGVIYYGGESGTALVYCETIILKDSSCCSTMNTTSYQTKLCHSPDPTTLLHFEIGKLKLEKMFALIYLCNLLKEMQLAMYLYRWVFLESLQTFFQIKKISELAIGRLQQTH